MQYPIGLIDPLSVEEEVNQNWPKFYQDQFGIRLQSAGIILPDHKHLDDQTIDYPVLIPKGLSIEQVIQVTDKLCGVRSYKTNPKELAVINDREPYSDYGVWIILHKLHQNSSGNLLKKATVPSVTLMEYLLSRSKFFYERGYHFDVELGVDIHRTMHMSILCAGSRDIDGKIPGIIVNWNNQQRIDIGYAKPTEQHPAFSTREVIQIPRFNG